MEISQRNKTWCFNTAVKLGFKVAESGGIEKGIEVANTIEHTYEALKRLIEKEGVADLN